MILNSMLIGKCQINFMVCVFLQLLFINIMMDSIFQKRNMRPTSEMYYFQLIPNLLTIKHPTLAKNLKASNSQFRLKINKGNQLCDEMKKSIAVKAINGKAAFDKVSLNFNLPSYIPNKNVEFIIVLLKSQDNGQQLQVGSYPLNSTNYILQLKNNQTKYFSLTANFGNDYSLAFDLYIDNSRFSLQKLIKQTRNEQKEGKLQNMLDVSKKNSLSSNTPTLNQAKSQIRSDSEKVEVVISGQGRFISPTRKIVRKQSQTRKVLKKGSSPDKSQDDNSSRKDLKFLSRNSQETPIIQKGQSLAQKEAKKLSQKIKQQEEKQRLEAQKREKQRKQAQLQKKRIQAQKKKDQQQAAKKAEQARQVAQEKRLEAQKKRQQQKQRKLQQQRKQNARIAAQQKKLQAIRKRQQQQKRKAQQQQRRSQQRKLEAQKSLEMQQQKKNQGNFRSKKIVSQVSNPTQQQQSDVKLNKKYSSGVQTVTKAKKPETDRNWTNKQSSTEQNQLQSRTVRSKHELIVVRVKTQDHKNDQNYTFKTDSVISKQKWNQPLQIKKTGSTVYDSKGRQIKNLKQSIVASKLKKDEPDMKTKILFVVFIIISVLLILNAMTPSSKRR